MESVNNYVIIYIYISNNWYIRLLYWLATTQVLINENQMWYWIHEFW